MEDTQVVQDQEDLGASVLDQRLKEFDQPVGIDLSEYSPCLEHRC